MLDHGFGFGLVEDASINLHGSDEIRVDVGGWSPVFDVTLTIGMSGTCWDAEGGGSISDTE